jgi:4-amino-4-deoxy-L-arabinose transferase-like glycosyltransferase
MPRSPRSAALLLIAVATALRLVWAAVFPILTDEAYHWQYTVHPAAGYFDHPPMTMLVAKAGLLACGGWVHPFSLRLGFVLLCAGTSLILYAWTSRWLGSPAGLWAVLGFSLSHYLTAFGGTFVLPDSPLLFFAALTWWQVSEAVLNPHSLRRWLLVGLAFGGALVSKYHAVLLPAGVVLYAIATPGARKLLWSPGPYLAVLVGGLVFSPVLWWNATHEWASFRFQGGRLGSGATTPVAHGGPLVWLLGPVVFLLPWMWFWLVVEFGRRVRRFGSVVGVERLLVCLSAAVLAFFLVNSFLSGRVLPHWPLVGFLPLFPLAGARWAELHARHRRWVRAMLAVWVAGEAVVLAGLLVQVNTGRLPLPRVIDYEMKHYSGWESVADELTARGVPDEPGVFVVTNHWEHAGQLGFALRDRCPVTCYHSFDARGFAFWSRPEEYVGRTGYLVVLDQFDEGRLLAEYGSYFERVTPFAEFPMTRGDEPFRPVRVYRCERGTRPYPFDFTVRAK